MKAVLAQTQRKAIPLLDLQALHAELRDELLAAITRVVDSQRFVQGDDVRALEAEIAAYCGSRFAVNCANGSDALYLALLALGIGPGELVATTPYSFFATAGSISRTGARPVFVDIDPVTFNIDPAKLAETLARKPGIKAVIPVHLFGGFADMDPIVAAARAHGCAVIEDGAQSIGAEYKGRRACFGDINCISFYPTKNLGAFGDAGMVTTDSDHLRERVAIFREHGGATKYRHDWIGINSRLDTIQAAILRVKLPHLDTWSEGRRRNAALYREHLAGVPVICPQEAPYQTRHIYNQFVIRTGRRDELKNYLRENGVGTDIYYPIPLHLQPCYQDLGYREGDLPISERAALESLALPIHSELAADDIAYICETIREFFSGRA